MISISTLYDKIDLLKSKGACVTNLYLTPDKTEKLLNDGHLQLFSFDDELLILRSDKEFYRLYCVSNSIPFANLNSILDGLNPLKPIVIDFILKSDSSEVGEILKSGVRLYSFHCKMVKSNIFEDVASISDDIKFANSEQAQTLLDSLYTNFDPNKEHLPTLNEINNSIERKQILISKGVNTSYLYFNSRGMISELKYLFIHPNDRGLNLGSSLLNCYFSVNQNIKNFFLWVEAANYRAQNLYLKNGYRFTGMNNYTFIKQIK